MSAYALTKTADRVAGTLVLEFIWRFGCPIELHSNQGRNFESWMFKEVCDILKIVKTRTTPYRPSANGQVERMNRTIFQILRCFIRGQKEDWDIHLATVGMAMRSAVNRQTGFTHNFRMLGWEVLQPIDLMIHPEGEEDRGTPVTYAACHQETMSTAHREARENYSNLNDANRGIMIYVWKKENTLYVMRFIDLTSLLCWNKVKQITAHLIRYLECDTSDFISVVSYC